ncbi:putative DD41D transposase [Trichonephila clavipes]|nr:putative DD41D transposase [Trichonephila clavipes]
MFVTIQTSLKTEQAAFDHFKKTAFVRLAFKQESDEAPFWLNGYVNKQNCRIWSEANPQVYVETPLHPEKLTVWCALWAGGIIGPYFFKNDEGHNVTVNGDRYRAMITNFFIPELNNHDVQELWFQQDGATCHTAHATIDLLKDTFGDRLISRFGPVNWPPISCDLTPLDYFLWGYVKSLVYADKPQALDHLEDNIRRVIADIRPQMLEKVIENWTSRLDYIRASRGITTLATDLGIDLEFPISELRIKVYLFVNDGVMNQLQIPSSNSRSLQQMDDLPYYLSATQYSAFCMSFTTFLMMISFKPEMDLNIKFQVQEEGSIVTDIDGIQPFNEMTSFKDIFPAAGENNSTQQSAPPAHYSRRKTTLLSRRRETTQLGSRMKPTQLRAACDRIESAFIINYSYVIGQIQY